MSSPVPKIDLKSLSPPQLEDLIRSFGKERYRSLQILRWLYQKSVHSIDEMTNLSKRFREELSKVGFISALHPLRVEQAKDGTRKFLFELEDGHRIESVLIPDRKRLTLCVSTQVGCALGCRFCLTGKMGFKRNLISSEILNQILSVRETLTDETPITNIVLMGMGEPLANYANTLRAIQLMTHPDAFKFSSRRITLSTVGLIPELEQLAKERISFRLAISLNASDEETRSHLMPINRRYPLGKVLEVCRNFPLRPRTRITFEYVLIAGINDSSADAKRLFRILRGIPSKVNLIPLNEAPGIPFKRPPEEKIRQFQEILMAGGMTAIVRASKGAEISAACGQLQAKSPSERPQS
ncbi:MAG: 23S rRNA (adenine(2503)-C(2))-methyltransferase RlmN [Syntrophaceae bacterium]|nr:23S rRNA (adenine(2503)-C(2))-methyltransferase RlmN [Syntrophaceae bacterium]